MPVEYPQRHQHSSSVIRAVEETFGDSLQDQQRNVRSVNDWTKTNGWIVATTVHFPTFTSAVRSASAGGLLAALAARDALLL